MTGERTGPLTAMRVERPGSMGSAHPLTAPYQAFATADGWINVGAANQANWLRLLGAIGAPRLSPSAAEPRLLMQQVFLIERGRRSPDEKGRGSLGLRATQAAVAVNRGTRARQS